MPSIPAMLRIPCLMSLWLSTAVADAAAGQLEGPPVPAELGTLDFMIGEWTVEGTFRNPEHVGEDRTLWYRVGEDAIVRFDGVSWKPLRRGESPRADSVLSAAPARVAPYAFQHVRDARRVQDGFALLVDDGRTSGTTLIYYDTGTQQWIATAFHAPTNAVVTSRAEATGAGPTDPQGPPVFEGRATDRRGERLFRRRYQVHGPDHYTIRTDVSFDDGVTWIVDQVRHEVRRR